MADNNQNNEQTAAQTDKPATEKKKLDKRSIITIIVAIIGFLAILFGVLAGCGVFGRCTPEDDTAKITITIEVNGGTGDYNDITFVLDENNSYTFTDEEKAAIRDALKRDGYELKGLSTTPDGEGGWTITIPEDAESPVKIYAIWEKKEEPQPVEKYTITFNMHGRGTKPADITDATALPAELPTVADVDGYGFVGWYLDEEYETAATAGATITANTTLHARWEAIFKFHENGLIGWGTTEGGVIAGFTEYGNSLNLTEITIPTAIDGIEVTIIDAGAFLTCTSLISVTIPDGITDMGQGAFSGCTNLKSVTLPNGLSIIEHHLFSQCASLESITIPSSVTGIAEGAFSGCTNLTSIKIPSGVTEINQSLFHDCTSLQSVIMPDGVTEIGQGAFSGCTSLEKVYYGGANSEAWRSILIAGGNVASDEDTDILTEDKVYYYSANEPTVEGRFWHYKNGEPEIWVCNDYLVKIFEHEENTLTGLTEYGKTLSLIAIPTVLDGDEITSIGSNAFENNETMTSVTIPEGITSIGTGAFRGCTGLTSIKIPDGVTSITHDVFSSCSSLKSIEIPSSLTNVGHGTFYGCPLTAVYFNGTSDEWNVYIDNSAASNGNFTTEIVYYYSEAMPMTDGKYWHYVSGVPVQWEVLSAEEIFTYNNFGAITGLTQAAKDLNLTQIFIPGTIGDVEVRSIDYRAFYNCSYLETIIIPYEIEHIVQEAFYGCTGLTTVYYEDTSEDWEYIEIEDGNGCLTGAEHIYYYSYTPPEDYSAEIFWHYVEGVPTLWDELSGAKVSACTAVEDYANGYIGYLDEDIESEAEMIATIESVRDNAITAINNAQTADEAEELAIEAMLAIDEILEALA